jgi:hypothetical protein
MGKRGSGKPVPGIKVSSVRKTMNDKGDVAFAASGDLLQHAGYALKYRKLMGQDASPPL